MTLKQTLPDIVRDPIEFLCSSREPIKLVDLAAMRDELAIDERWSRLKLTLSEYRYVLLHYGWEMTQQEVREYLNWDALRIQAVTAKCGSETEELPGNGCWRQAKN